MINRAAFDKDPWRGRNVDFVLVPGPLVLVRGNERLILSSYIQMSGTTGFRMNTLLKTHLPNAQQFIQADDDPEVWFLNKLALLGMPSKDRYFAIGGDFYHACFDAIDAHSPPAAIFEVDEMHTAGNSRWWNGLGRNLVGMVQKALTHHHESLLILNCTIDRGPGTPSERLIQHTRELCKYFEKWGLDARAILGQNMSEAIKVDDREHKQAHYVGAYDIYRSEGRPLRMATLRLRFREREVIVDHAVAY